jgi:polysaccharide export outer membrane protein
MRLRPLFVVLLAALALAGCANPRARYAVAPVAPMARSDLDVMMYGAPGVPVAPSYAVRRAREVMPIFDDGPYTLDAGDKLRIVVFGQDALSNNYIVDAQGCVALPLIGSISARGQTTTQLAASISARLKQSFIRDPSVAVEIETYRPFFVLGEVTYPGQYPYVPNMTVENAIAIAGGFTPRGYRYDVAVTRRIDGGPARLTLPIGSRVRPGDTITVSERWF